MPVTTRWWRRALQALGLLLVFVLSAAAGVVLHADLPPAQRLIGRVLSRVLSDALVGTVRIDSLDLASPTRVNVPRAALLDAQGRTVLVLGDVRVDVSVRHLVRNFVLSAGSARIIVDHVRVERADVDLVPDPVTGEPTIVSALAPADTGTPSPQSGASPATARVYLPVIELGRVVGHAQFRNQPPFEGDVRNVRGQLLASPRGLAVDVQRFGAVLTGYGTKARGTGTLSVRAPGPVHGTFEGFLGDLELKAAVSLLDHHVEITTSFPSAPPEVVKALVPGWPIRKPISGEVKLAGDLPELDAKASLLVGSSTILAAGPVHLGKEPGAEADVEIHRLDLQAFADEAPATSMDASGHVKLGLEDGRLVIRAAAHTAASVLSLPDSAAGDHGGESRVREIPIPDADLTAVVSDGAVSGSADVHEPGSPVHADYSVSKGGAVDVQASTSGLDLGRSRRTKDLGLAGRARGNARLHVENKELRLSFGSDVTGLAAAGVTARSLHVEGQLRSRTDAPTAVTGTLTGETDGLVVSKIPIGHASLNVRGNQGRVQFEAKASGAAGFSGEAAGNASLVGGVVLEHTKVSLRRGAVGIEGYVEKLSPEDRSIAVPSFRLTGAGGDLHGSLVLRKNLLEASASGSDVDLGALATAFDLPRGTFAGKARVELELAAGRDVTRGRIRIGFGNATLGGVPGISLAASADLDGEHLTGDASGMVRGLGNLGATWDTTLGGPAYELASYRDLTGSAELQLTQWMLATLGGLLPDDSAVRELDGQAFAQIRMERRTKESGLPNVFAAIETRGLALTVVPGKGAPVAVSGVDVSVTGSIDGVAGASSGAVRLGDAGGDLATASFNVQLDPVALRRDPARAWEKLLGTPVTVVANLPSRPFASLPPFLHTEDIAGKLAGTLTLTGSLREPTLSANLLALGLGLDPDDPRHAVDVRADARYEWASHDVTAQVDAALAGRQVASGTLHATLPDGDLERWVGDTTMQFDSLPLDLLPPLSRSQVLGGLTGQVGLSRHETPGGGGTTREFTAALHLENPSIGGTSLGEGQLDVRSSGDRVQGHLSMIGGTGALGVDASAGWRWEGALPALSADGPVSLKLKAKSFGAAVLSPALRGVVSNVTGKLDADVDVNVTAQSAASGTGWNGTVAGTANLVDGSALIDVLGLEVRDIHCQARADGTESRTHIAVRGVTGKVRSASDNVQGSADFFLSGVRVTTGSASLTASDVPLLFRGAPQGRATGSANARFSREPDRMRVDLDVPRLSVRLPQSSSRDIIDLSENRDVVIVQKAEKEEESGDSLPWRLAFHLGKEVNVRRSDVDVGIGGDPVLDLGPGATMSGWVDLVPGGRVPVLGKVFNVDHGRLIFDTGENDNPRLDVEASWRSQSDIVIYAQVTGTFREARIHVRSDPPRPETEVYALLFGGGSSDQTASDQPGGATGGQGAVALGTGVGALGVNEFLQNSPVELRVDSTVQSKPRYTAAVRVRPNLWFEASTYQQSQTTEGVASDRNVVSGTVDYRFTPRWSLRTEVGTSGGTLDLLWQYRY